MLMAGGVGLHAGVATARWRHSTEAAADFLTASPRPDRDPDPEPQPEPEPEPEPSADPRLDPDPDPSADPGLDRYLGGD